MSAFFTSGLFRPNCQINPAETPINVYNAVQTGPKIQLGGLKTGLFKATYQESIPVAVAKPESPPIARQTMLEIMILMATEFFMLFHGFIQPFIEFGMPDLSILSI